nr:uncharacterized protein LOC111840046 [Paramormyrops kingsleyae]
MRRHLEEGQRRYQRKRKVPSVSTGPSTTQADDPNEWLTVIKRMKPSSENITTIRTAMDKTFNHRRNWISAQSPAVSEIAQQYPRFIDMPSLLDVEFGKMFEGKGEMLIRKWESTVMPKLESIAALEKGSITSLLHQITDCNDNEKCYTMLRILTHLLPPTSGRGAVSSHCSVKSAISYLLDIVPFAIVARNDRVVIPLEDESLTCALDKLFKFYWVFNLVYPAQLTSVFIFLEYVYDLPMSKIARRSKVLELISKLQVLS